jgi:AraC-like DNA-binding protein
VVYAFGHAVGDVRQGWAPAQLGSQRRHAGVGDAARDDRAERADCPATARARGGIGAQHSASGRRRRRERHAHGGASDHRGAQPPGPPRRQRPGGDPRRTAYRLFESEGGLGSYIVNARLRHAALDLVRFPNMSITDLAYGLGFGGPSDFSRAFRRAYLMLPRDFRVMCLMET